jgi:ABC-type glycerol-3-phosphate transport system substrate-binding protein
MKKTIGLLLALGLVTLLGACAGGGEAPPADAPAESPAASPSP